MKALQEIIKEIKDEVELLRVLKSLCKKHGGAWTYRISVFTHTVHFMQFQNPSSIPDQFSETTRNIRDLNGWRESGTLAWRGELRGFSDAVMIREDRRAMLRG